LFRYQYEKSMERLANFVLNPIIDISGQPDRVKFVFR
jgi:hypothetical protein